MRNEHYTLPFGRLVDNEEVIVYEITNEQTNLKEAEQLDELKRQDDLFFPCQHSIVDAEWLKIYYKRDKTYKPLHDILQESVQRKLIIVENILKIHRLVGTQYTTMIHPENIYVNNSGEIKFVHRGIRNVLPPIEFTTDQILKDMKELIILLFTGKWSFEWSESLHSDQGTFAAQINKARTLKELHEMTIEYQSLLPKEESKFKEKYVQDEVTKKPKQKISILSGMLIGFLCGLTVLYVTQVLPLSKVASNMDSSNKAEQQSLENDKMELVETLEYNESVIQAYEFALKDEPEEAIRILESLEKLELNERDLLVSQYMRSGSIEHLSNAAQLSDANHPAIVDKLVSLQTEEANDLILQLDSNVPEVGIEQAWLNESYEEVIARYEQTPDNNRAKLLAARSYIELDEPNEALQLGEELQDVSVQIASIEKQMELVESNNDLNEEEREERLEELEQELEDRAR